MASGTYVWARSGRTRLSGGTRSWRDDPRAGQPAGWRRCVSRRHTLRCWAGGNGFRPGADPGGLRPRPRVRRGPIGPVRREAVQRRYRPGSAQQRGSASVIPRYTRPAMGRVWSDEHRMELWLQVELAVCEAWAGLGVIPQEDMAALRSAGVQADRSDELFRETHHDM